LRGAGDNFSKRLLPALMEVEGRLDTRIFDIRRLVDKSSVRLHGVIAAERP
jgi:hypothetical protein